jgi:hypothetical protein
MEAACACHTSYLLHTIQPYIPEGHSLHECVPLFLRHFSKNGPKYDSYRTGISAHYYDTKGLQVGAQQGQAAAGISLLRVTHIPTRRSKGTRKIAK